MELKMTIIRDEKRYHMDFDSDQPFTKEDLMLINMLRDTVHHDLRMRNQNQFSSDKKEIDDKDLWM